MRKIRTLIALIVALFLAAAASLTVYFHLDRPQKQAQAIVNKKKKDEPVVEKPRELSTAIEKGMRAVTIQVENQGNLLEQIVPGDWVDLVATTPIPGDREGQVSRLLFSGAKVIKLNKKETAGGRKAIRQGVTLMLGIDDAVAVAAANTAATFYLLLRNPEDKNRDKADSVAFESFRGISRYAGQKRDINKLVSSGMRAITLKVEPTDGVSGIFAPGDRVDVLVTCPYGNIAGGSEVGAEGVVRETHRNSRILLQNIKIAATSQSLVWESERGRAVQRVTLEVTPQDAEKLTVLADSKKGKSTLRLISRNSNDTEKIKTPGQDLLTLLTKRRPYKRVELIRGPMRQEKTFYQ
ncbi:MAG: Flp pilus assembly protein CpaB [Deltaproteobacteria bacterium]|nr:MAG: Flp pilus assembly protein CpaB [Deltaproteobacteria bacterium]